MGSINSRPLKAFVRFDGSGRIVAGSLILRRKKPKVGKWVEIPAYECCNPTTTTTTTVPPTTTSTTTTTTTAAPIVTPIEDFGADPLYILRYAQFNVTPIVGEGKSLITYTGADNIFQADFVTRQVQFVLFNGHLNPAAYPANGVTNGNYVPSEITARYSFVTDYIDGKNVKVNFVYNGGNLVTPQAQTNGSGYFFIDNRAAFRAAFHQNTTRTVGISLQAGKTYVTKGGWNSEILKPLSIVSDGATADKPAIKISIEDGFSLDNSGYSATAASFADTFTSPFFFLLTAGNNGMNIDIQNINILPSHFTVPSGQYVSSYLYVPLFSHNYESGGFQRASVNTLYGSNGAIELEYIEANPVPSLIRQPNFVMQQFAFSNDGGVINNDMTDIGTYQEFVLQNSTYRPIQFHNLKFSKFNGNLLKVLGNTAEDRSYVLIPDINNVVQTTGVQYNVKVVDDTAGKKRLLRNDGGKSWYIGANQYWFGTGINEASTFRISRLQYCKVANLGTDYYIFLSNQAESQQAYGGTFGQFPTILNSTDTFLYEEIPVAGITTIAIDGVVNKKISDTEFDIYGWGLQATRTYPVPVADGSSLFFDIPVGDIVNYLGTDYTIIERRRIISVGPNPQSNCAGWRIKLSAAITDANPTFGVTTSGTEFLLDGNFHALTSYFYAFGGYFCYASANGNFILENCDFNGFGRMTDNPKNMNGTAHTYSINSPLYLLTKYQQFISANYVGSDMLWESQGASGLQWRNTITGVNTNRVLVDASRIAWRRTSAAGNLVDLRNVPTLIIAGGLGESRIQDPVLDGQGLVIEDAASFNFTGLFPSYPMNNIYLKKTDYVGLNRNLHMAIWGVGTLDISNFTSDKTSPTSSTYMGIEYRRATGFTGNTVALTITGNGGRTGFRYDGVFANNTLILTNWTIVPIVFAPTGWAVQNPIVDNGNTWPATPTPPVPPNFSIT